MGEQSRSVSTGVDLRRIGTAAVVDRVCRFRNLAGLPGAQSQIWLRAGQMALSRRLQGEQRLEQLGENVLGFLADYLGAQVGALYLADGRPLRLFAGYALPADAPRSLLVGDGLLGQAVKENRPLRVQQLPAEYLPVASATGRSQPRELLIAPASIDSRVQARAGARLSSHRPRVRTGAARAGVRDPGGRDAQRPRTARGSRSCSRRRSARPRSCRRSRRSCASATRSSRSRAARSRNRRRGSKRSRPSSSRPTRSSRSRRSMLEHQSDELHARAGRARPRRPRSSSAPTSTRASSWPT